MDPTIYTFFKRIKEEAQADERVGHITQINHIMQTINGIVKIQYLPKKLLKHRNHTPFPAIVVSVIPK